MSFEFLFHARTEYKSLSQTCYVFFFFLKSYTYTCLADCLPSLLPTHYQIQPIGEFSCFLFCFSSILIFTLIISYRNYLPKCFSFHKAAIIWITKKTYFLPKAKTMSCEKGILEFEEVECISVENSQSVNYIGHIAYHNVIMIIKFNYSCKSKVHSFFDKNDLAAIMMVIVITLAEYCCPIKKQMMLFLLWEYFAAFYFVSIHNHTCVKWFI